MAYIDKTASRLPRIYDLSNIEEFIATMEGNNPFDKIKIIFYDQSYRRSEEELEEDQENGDGRYDRRALTLDTLYITKCYDPAYQDRYIPRGDYYATMDWPFIPKDKEVLELDNKWEAWMSGHYSELTTYHRAIKPALEWNTEDENKHTHLTLTIGKTYKMRFPKEQLIYIYANHQNAYDRGYNPNNY